MFKSKSAPATRKELEGLLSFFSGANDGDPAEYEAEEATQAAKHAREDHRRERRQRPQGNREEERQVVRQNHHRDSQSNTEDAHISSAKKEALPMNTQDQTPQAEPTRSQPDSSDRTGYRTPNRAPARVEPLYCPVCPDVPNLRRKETDIVCGNCYRQYTNDAAVALTRGERVPNVFEWTVKQGAAILSSLEAQQASAQDRFARLQQEVENAAVDELKRNSKGQSFAKEVWQQALWAKKQELWRARKGNHVYAEMKTLETRISLIKNILAKAQEQPAVETPAAPATEVAAPEPEPTVESSPAVDAAEPAVTEETPAPRPKRARRTVKTEA